MGEVSVYFGVVVSVSCCSGINHCKVCKGRCCSLVNDVINVLVEYGEIDPNAEVIILCY